MRIVVKKLYKRSLYFGILATVFALSYMGFDRVHGAYTLLSGDSDELTPIGSIAHADVPGDSTPGDAPPGDAPPGDGDGADGADGADGDACDGDSGTGDCS